MYLALGAPFGALAGALAWLIAGAFVAHHHDEPVDLRALLRVTAAARSNATAGGCAQPAAFVGVCLLSVAGE